VGKKLVMGKGGEIDLEHRIKYAKKARVGVSLGRLKK